MFSTRLLLQAKQGDSEKWEDDGKVINGYVVIDGVDIAWRFVYTCRVVLVGVQGKGMVGPMSLLLCGHLPTSLPLSDRIGN